MVLAVGDVYTQIPRRDEVRELMNTAQAHAREQPGCVSYVFAETVADPGHYVVVQQWLDQDALDAHYRSQDFARYQAGIDPWLVHPSELRVHQVTATTFPQDSAPMDPRLAD